MIADYPGLTAAEVADRVRQGLLNRSPRSEWADYARIISRNVFNLFNFLVTPAAIALFFLDKYQGAISVSSMAIVNSAVGLIQELKAKRHLDKLAIMVETIVHVRRDGDVRDIPASQVVLGDLILISSGETIVADGTVMESQFLEVDEALLTGESDPVRREVGQQLLSGSYCVAGQGSYRADRIGEQAFAQSTTSQARDYRYAPSPLTKTINLLIQILTYTAIGLCCIYLILFLLGRLVQSEMVENMAATITSMVPQGLVLTATVSFTLGAVQLSLRGAVVQRLSAVESMAAIDVICTDKTGTLTTNQLRLDRVSAFKDVDEAEGRRLLSLFAAASPDHKSKTILALRAASSQPAVEALDALPFKSQNRYSAVRIADGSSQRVLVIGAPEALRPRLDPADCELLDEKLAELLPSGLRLLLFTESMAVESFAGSLGAMRLRPLLVVALTDELRPHASEVLEALAGQGIQFKVISGDNPATVQATVSHLTLPLANDPVVTGDELSEARNAAELIANRSVFGRVSPAQKMQIVKTLQEQGRHVAMVGDGVNDVLPIKRADLGIAMGAGSQACKTVSSIVLKNNDFALLPEALEEGRTILRNLRRAAKLFLVKNVYSLILILAYSSGLFGVPFPYEPQQVTLLNWLVIGIPAFAIALSRERSRVASKQGFLGEVGGFALRTGCIFALAGLAILLLAVHSIAQHDVMAQRTLLLSVLILLGITALFRALEDSNRDTSKSDARFGLLALAAIPAYLAMMYVPVSAEFFQLRPLSVSQWLYVIGVVFPTAAVTFVTDRSRPSSDRPAPPMPRAE